MRALGAVVILGVTVTLLALLVSRFSPKGHDSTDHRQRANPFFWLIGSLAVLAGTGMLVGGAIAVADAENTGAAGPQDTADPASLVTWGVVVLVNGVYVWRGARRRGWHDRLGRLLIIVGYALLGIALSRTLHISEELWGSTTSGSSNDVLDRTMLAFLGWGVPAALLVRLGTWIAPEKILLTAQAQANY